MTAVRSFEKSPEVLWLRTLNPWSPDPGSDAAGGRLTLTHGDISLAIADIADASVDAVLHDPPRFGIAGELYSQAFYDQLARVIRRKGRLFHYTGTPNKLTSGRDVPAEVARRLQRAGFVTEFVADGVLARKQENVPYFRSSELTIQIASELSTTPGTISYSAKIPPLPCFHRITVRPPTSMPASAPLRVMRGQ